MSPPSPIAVAVFYPVAFILVALLVLRWRRKRKKLNDPHRTLKFYDRQMIQYASLRAESREEAARANLAEREVRLLRRELAASEASRAEASREAEREVSAMQRRLLRNAAEKEAKILREENARLLRRLERRWEQIEEMGRDLASYREQDTVVEPWSIQAISNPSATATDSPQSVIL